MRLSRRGEDSAALLRMTAHDMNAEPALAPAAVKTPPKPFAPSAMPESAFTCAKLIQAHFRGARVRRGVNRWLGRAVGVPDLARAKAHARSLLPHDQEGRLLPLTCPIECFTVFGAGVYAYMRWTVLMRRVFLISFLFSVANMVNRLLLTAHCIALPRANHESTWCSQVNNIFGGELSEGTWLSIPTIGNAKKVNASYGASEVLVLGTFLWGMFAAVKIVRMEEALLQVWLPCPSVGCRGLPWPSMTVHGLPWPAETFHDLPFPFVTLDARVRVCVPAAAAHTRRADSHAERPANQQASSHRPSIPRRRDGEIWRDHACSPCLSDKGCSA